MGQEEIIYIIRAIFAGLFLIFILYAWEFELAPSPHGWRWVSEAVVVCVCDLAMMAVIFLGLIYLYGLDGAVRGWWLIGIPVVTHILSGIPIITAEIWKRRKDNQRSSEIAQAAAMSRSPFKIPSSPEIPVEPPTGHGKQK